MEVWTGGISMRSLRDPKSWHRICVSVRVDLEHLPINTKMQKEIYCIRWPNSSTGFSVGVHLQTECAGERDPNILTRKPHQFSYFNILY
jgi:hypothetical protein